MMRGFLCLPIAMVVFRKLPNWGEGGGKTATMMGLLLMKQFLRDLHESTS